MVANAVCDFDRIRHIDVALIVILLGCYDQRCSQFYFLAMKPQERTSLSTHVLRPLI